jgi:hypothetical protein
LKAIAVSPSSSSAGLDLGDQIADLVRLPGDAARDHEDGQRRHDRSQQDQSQHGVALTGQVAVARLEQQIQIFRGGLIQLLHLPQGPGARREEIHRRRLDPQGADQFLFDQIEK